MREAPLHRALRRATQDLTAVGAEFALVGGIAISTRTEPRFTRDIDLAIRVDDDSAAEALVVELGYAVVATAEHRALRRLATARLRAPGGADAPIVDLLFASSSIEPEVVAAAERLRLSASLEVPVARVGHLLAMKVLAVKPARPQDASDILALLRVAQEADLELARTSLELIERRGASRDKDLAGVLAHYLAIQPGDDTDG